MDLSALIFVALAVAWAVYLVPKALKHHDEVVRSRSVEKFSHTMRVLARREPVNGRNARLVVSPVRPAERPPVETKARTPLPVAPVRTPGPAASRAAARKAARRRRNVLAVLLVANAVVIGLAVAGVVGWPWGGVPAGLLVAWLVACRVSVKAERRSRTVVTASPAALIDAEPPTSEVPVVPDVPESLVAEDVAESDAAELPAVLSGEIPIVRESLPGSWDMVPTPLPTYVSKSTAQRRSVSTIDLDSTGVWSSGRNDEDSALAREAEQADRAARDEVERKRVSGA